MSTPDSDPQLQEADKATITVPPTPEPSFGLEQLYEVFEKGYPKPSTNDTWGDIITLQGCYEQLLANHSALQAENQERARILQELELEHAKTREALQREIQDLKEELYNIQRLQEERQSNLQPLCSAQSSQDGCEARVGEMENTRIKAVEKLETAYAELGAQKVVVSPM